MTPMPFMIGLCPGEHRDEFYMPLELGHSLICPKCSEIMIVYVQSDEMDRRVHAAYAEDCER